MSNADESIPYDLGPFNDGVAELQDANGKVVGYVAAKVERIRNLFFRRSHVVWLLLTWIEGERERIIQDYEPWTYVTELRQGFLLWDDLWNSHQADAPPTRYTARWLAGAERDEAWGRYGVHEPVGTYMP